MAAIKKVLSNVAQNLSTAEKAQARANIDAASTSALANKQDRLTAGANITIQNNVVSSNPNLRIAFNDFRTSYYSVESGTTYRWTYTGGATKNKAILEITGLDPAKTYLVIYRACLNSSQSEQCVCLNSGDSTYSFSGSDKWFKHIAESGATNYPYQHNIQCDVGNDHTCNNCHQCVKKSDRNCCFHKIGVPGKIGCIGNQSHSDGKGIEALPKCRKTDSCIN